MIATVKAWAKRRWPRLSLRTYLFASFFLVAALPGVGAVALRVYENALVRQTEAELVAQGAALAAGAAALWPASPRTGAIASRVRASGEPQMDLSATPILPERPAPGPAAPPAADAVGAAAPLSPVLAATRAATGAEIVLLDRTGRVVPGGAALGTLPEVAAALRGSPATVLRRAAGAPGGIAWLSRAAGLRVHHARPIVVEGRVAGALLLSRPARSLFLGLADDAGKIALGIAAILGALIVLSGLLSRGIARPIEELRRAARGVAAGRGAVPPVPPTAAVEIQDLYRDFAAMGEAIEARSRYLRDFAHAISHEFKTPLAGIRGAIELLQDHADAMSAEERRRFLANADADAGRLTMLVSRLLELARADMTVADGGMADAAAVARALADALGRGGVTIAVHAPAALRPAAIEAATLERVLTVLIDNAVHAGARRIDLSLRGEGETVELTVSDDGAGIPPADRARIFEPFFTSRRTAGGSGLGLSIARSLLAAWGGELALLDTSGGTTLRLRLPAR